MDTNASATTKMEKLIPVINKLQVMVLASMLFC